MMTAMDTSPESPSPRRVALSALAALALGAFVLVSAWARLDDGGRVRSGRAAAAYVALVLAGACAAIATTWNARRRRDLGEPMPTSNAWRHGGPGVLFFVLIGGALARSTSGWVSYGLAAVGGLACTFALLALVTAVERSRGN
jgi:divalent metal cation (Fe/Co/Zn/Cd) transporter